MTYLNNVHSTLSSGIEAIARLIPLISSYAEPSKSLTADTPRNHLIEDLSSGTEYDTVARHMHRRIVLCVGRSVLNF